MDFLTEEEYLDHLDSLPRDNQHLDDRDPQKFIAKMGAEAISDLLERINLDELSSQLRYQAATETSQQRKTDALKRLKIVEAFKSSNAENRINRPEWMVVRMVPVIPPELRPLVPLEGGRFATSDLNDLYRRVIIRNNRLKRLMEIKAPDVILRNEKRMLQEAVDSLFDNSRKVNAVKADGNRALKSLSDMLKGKQGRFRQNLLGKRVDYSGRSVIVVGPEMKLHECGLPKDMAAELFKPFVIRKLIERGIVKTVKSAKKLVDRKEPVVWDILENVLKGHPVLLNRAPTLHRLGIQAFQPKLIEGKAIQLHPLVCTAFNADFDGDQMAVHVPLGNAAILEAQLLMLASHNILNPANGSPITVPSQDMVLGLYYITKGRKSTPEHPIKGEGRVFYSEEEANIAYNEGMVALHAWVKVRTQVRNEAGGLDTKLVDTTMGRILFNRAIPQAVGFINELMTKKSLRDLIGVIVRQTDIPTTADFLDQIKELGFKMAFKGGLSFNLDDVMVPENKVTLIEAAQREVEEVTGNYNMGFITNNERYNQVIDIWTRTNSKITDTLMKEIASDKQGFNSVYMMLDSGARGSKEQIRQLGGMRGLMAKPQKSGGAGEIIENPILSNFKEGLNVLEYFISTHGARKGLADTALKTADAGYLTRRLHDVAQDVIINEEDCGTLRGIEVTALKDNEEVVEPLKERIVGRVAASDVVNPLDNQILLAAGEEITEAVAAMIEASPVEAVEIRSVLTCASVSGVCVKCYGRNLATNRTVQIGEAVGVIAAQSIGEPGTQLTLRTFHVGGVAGNIATESQLVAKFDGLVEFDEVRTVTNATSDKNLPVETVVSRSGEIKIMDFKTRLPLMTNVLPYGATLSVKAGDKIKKGDLICIWDPYNALIISEFKGKADFEHIVDGITYREESDEQTGHKEKVIIDTKDKTKNPAVKILDSKKNNQRTYNLPVGAHLQVNEGDVILPGTILAKIPRSTTKTRDITGGLPRVTELFEARNPSNPAVVSEIDGVVTFGGIKRGNREIQVESKDGQIKKYLVPLSKHILVQDNDFIKAGDPLSDGAITPAAILGIKGPGAVQEYLVDNIQEVYRLQGVKINDKHFEVIVRQMMQKVVIVDPGNTSFLEQEVVNKQDFMRLNDEIFEKQLILNAGDSNNLRQGDIVPMRKVRDENSALKRKDLKQVEFVRALPATSQPLLQGITRASLGTKSFISAASFQETTKVLNEAAIAGKVDELLGLKENVIVGHLIPAGTGVRAYEKMVVGSLEEYQRLMASKEEFETEESLISESNPA
jgi:DNA-directed RNA polymerase subunit beta'